MARPRFSAKAWKAGKKNGNKCNKENASSEAVKKSRTKQKVGFKDMPPEVLLIVYKSTEDLVDKFALVKACSPSILDTEWQTHDIAHLKNQMATITDDSQLIRICEIPRFLDTRNRPINPAYTSAASNEDIAMYTLRSSVLWPRALCDKIDFSSAEDVEARMQSGWFFRPFEHAGDSWQLHLREWLERILMQEICGTRRPSLERLEKVLWGRWWEERVRNNGGFIAINMNVEDVGFQVSDSAPGKRHEKLLLTVEEIIPLLRNILLVWCSTPKKEAPWDKVDGVPMVRDWDGDFWEVGELQAELLELEKDRTPEEENKALIERLKGVTHEEVLTKLAAEGVELGEGWEQWDGDYEIEDMMGGDSTDGDFTHEDSMGEESGLGYLTFEITAMADEEGGNGGDEDDEVEETEEEAKAREERRHAIFMNSLEIRRPDEINPYAHTGYEDEGDEEFATRIWEGEGKILEEWDDEKFWEEKREAWGLEDEEGTMETVN